MVLSEMKGGHTKASPRSSDGMKEARAKYHHTVEPTRALERDGDIVVSARLSGDFPNSPLSVEHIFKLKGGKITSMEIR